MKISGNLPHSPDFTQFLFFSNLYPTLCCISYIQFCISYIHLPQIDADDVITRDEQIYVLIGAHAKCERNIQEQISLVKGLCVAFPLKPVTWQSSSNNRFLLLI